MMHQNEILSIPQDNCEKKWSFRPISFLIKEMFYGINIKENDNTANLLLAIYVFSL